MLIREARDADLGEASRIMVAAYRQYAAEIPDELYGPYEEEIADVSRRLPHSTLIVAEDDEGRIVGAVTYYKDATLSEHEGWPSDYAEMRLLAVAPECRGSGLGRKLAEECIRRARDDGAPYIGLHTSKLMHVARDMYERIGFERVPEFDFYPSEDITATAYRLKL